MAAVPRFVNTASTAGGDGTTNATSGATRAYATQAEWEAAAGGSATDDYIVDCCGTAVDATAVIVDFAVNITTGSVLIRGNRGDSAGFYAGVSAISTSHYRLAVGDVGFKALSLLENKTTVDGIQVEYGHSTSNGIAISFGGANTQTVKNCRVRNTNATDFGIFCDVLGGSLIRTVQNNLIVGFDVCDIKMTIATHYSPTHNVLQNTCYGGAAGSGVIMDRGAGSSAPTLNVKGNAFGSHTGSDITVTGSLGTLNYADNATEDFDQGTTNEIDIGVLTDAWTNPGTDQTSDFTVKNTSSALYNAVNPTLVTTDITDFTRDGSNHDVGCFELVVAAEAAAASVYVYQQAVNRASTY